MGKDERENVEVKRWGTVRQFDFQAKPHWELGAQLGILDLGAGGKSVQCALCCVLGGWAKLEQALISFHDRHAYARARIYRSLASPFMVGTAGIAVWDRSSCRNSLTIFFIASMRKGSLLGSIATTITALIPTAGSAGYESLSRRDSG